MKNLTKMEKKIIFFILNRKMKKTNFDEKKKNFEIENILFIYKNFHLQKRFEEVFKFGFKFFINKKKIFFKKKFPEKKINSNFIYNFYFLEISKKIKISILEFFDPTKKKQKLPYIKTFGKKYLKLILKSEKFKIDFLHFLKNDLKNFYFEELLKKIKNMFFQLFKKFENFQKNHKVNHINFENNNNHRGDHMNFKNKKNFEISKKKKKFENFNEEILFEKNAYNYFIKNSQCKIPWSSVEIDDSVNKLLSYIKELMYQ